MQLRRTHLRSVLGSLALSLCMTQALPAQVTVKYDRFNDYTKVSMEGVELSMKWPVPQAGLGTRVELSAFFLCLGNQVCEPEDVMLRFVSTSKYSWHFSTHYLVILADATRIDFGDLDYSGSLSALEMLEIMTVDIPFETLRLMVNAKQLEGKLGMAEFELTHDQRAGLRALLDKTVP